MTSTAKATPLVRIPVALDGALLRRIVDIRFPRGVNDFLDSWHCATDGRGKPFTKAPDNRATLYRWFRGDLPGSAETLVELGAMLGIDPFCLFVLAGNDPAAATAKILTALESGLWQHKSMSLLSDFLGRRADWPPKAVGARFHGGWHTFDFFHDPTDVAGIYGHFRISFSETSEPEIPKLLHIAYRHEPHFGGRWLQYGFVRFLGDRALLININGSIELGFASSPAGPYAVETVFGLGPADFRLASLTPFTATAHNEPSTDPGRVGFR
jgi:hypothetical protein